jgi:hypothetical protein
MSICIITTLYKISHNITASKSIVYVKTSLNNDMQQYTTMFFYVLMHIVQHSEHTTIFENVTVLLRNT